MTEQLPEDKQRGIYEWFYPELKGVWWKLTVNRFCPERGKTWARRRRNKYGLSPAKWVHPLYMPDGKENWNFVRECVEKLAAEGVGAEYVCGVWELSKNSAECWVDATFFVALSELLESK